MRRKVIVLAGAVAMSAAAGGLVACSDCKPCAAQKPGMAQPHANPAAAKQPMMQQHKKNPCAATQHPTIMYQKAPHPPAGHGQ